MYVLPDLPYAHDALAPTISAETLKVHHGKHHATYVEKANALAKEAGLADLPLEELILAAKERKDRKLFNNAAQAWNHAFFWESMTPKHQAPSGELAQAVDAAFGGLAELKSRFVDEGINHFASGWVWLAMCDEKLEVISTHDANDTFLHRCETPLLTCDVWEHAYYLDHKNDRKAFLSGWFDKLANWRFAEAQYAAAMGEGDLYRYPERERAEA
ncbi:MAG: superoxide dismutase [Novosphingobium sp.]